MLRSVNKPGFILLVVLLSVLPSSRALAAPGGITLSPPLRDITLGPGLLEADADITLTNNTNQQITAKLKLVDLKALGQFGGNTLGQAGLSDSYGLADWMTLPGGDRLLIPAGKTVTAAVSIVNRPDLTPGGHYGAIIVTPETSDTVQSDVGISQQLVSLVFVKKLGGEKYGLDLQEVKVKNSQNSLPESVDLTFVSTGNVHVTPRGYVEIRDPKGRLVSKAIINPDSLLLLPGSSRLLTGLFQPVENSNRSGTYKVTAFYRYHESESFTTKDAYFERSGISVDPRMAGALVVSVLVVGALVVLRFKRRRSNK